MVWLTWKVVARRYFHQAQNGFVLVALPREKVGEFELRVLKPFTRKYFVKTCSILITFRGKGSDLFDPTVRVF